MAVLFRGHDMAELKKGDNVEWVTSQCKTTGVIKQKLTKPRKIKGHRVAASPDDPQFLVETAESKKLAAHRPDALKKKGSAS